MDKITISKLEIFARHGVYDFEKQDGQTFYIDIEFSLFDNIIVDDINNTVDYGKVALETKEFFTSNNYDLIEFASQDLACHLLKTFSKIKQITVTVNKPNAPISVPFENVSATVTRGWHTAYIAVGSNLGDKEKYINDAIKKMGENDKIKLEKVSTLIETLPYGVTDQPNFLNGAIKIETIYSPFELLSYLQSLEKDAKRVKIRHWGERTLDLDILMYDNEIIFTDELKIPHPEMDIRDFVLIPLQEIEPYLVHPITKKNVTFMLNELKK